MPWDPGGFESPGRKGFETYGETAMVRTYGLTHIALAVREVVAAAHPG